MHVPQLAGCLGACSSSLPDDDTKAINPLGAGSPDAADVVSIRWDEGVPNNSQR